MIYWYKLKRTYHLDQDLIHPGRWNKVKLRASYYRYLTIMFLAVVAMVLPWYLS